MIASPAREVLLEVLGEQQNRVVSGNNEFGKVWAARCGRSMIAQSLLLSVEVFTAADYPVSSIGLLLREQSSSLFLPDGCGIDEVQTTPVVPHLEVLDELVVAASLRANSNCLGGSPSEQQIRL